MAMLEKKLALAGAAALAATLGASEAQAAAELEIDINDATAISTGGLTYHAGSPFNLVEGTIDISGGFLAEVSLNGGDDEGAAMLESFTATITSDASGEITGGSLSVFLDTGDLYTASILGDIVTERNGIIVVQGLTFSGLFQTDPDLGNDGIDIADVGTFDGTFADADLSVFSFPNGLLSGSAGTLQIERSLIDAGGDDGVNVEIAVTVPTPGAALAAIPMLGIMGLRRRRRQG